jgi:hypothetical protein
MGQNANGTYTNDRTGNTYANQALSVAIDGDDTAWAAGQGVAVVSTAIPIKAYDNAGNVISANDTRARDIYGNLVTNQTQSSQYWMNAGYTGADPTYSQKLASDDAMVAYNNAVAIAQAAASKYGFGGVSAGIAALSQSSSTQTQGQTSSTTAALPDLAGLASPYITWITNNLLWIVLIVAGIYIVPSLIPHGRRA